MIVLVGFMGAGKSTVGRLLAEQLNLSFIDTDAEIESRAGRSIAEIFADDGEPEFRRLEKEFVLRALGGKNAVIALGGGAVEDESIRAQLGNATVIHLELPTWEALERIGEDENRPMLDLEDPFALQARRRPLYAEVADETIDVSQKNVERIVGEIEMRLQPDAEG